MVKIWGGFSETKKTYHGCSFIRHGKGEKKLGIFMKCPKADDIQRLVIARYLMKISNPYVYAMKKMDLEFEKKVDRARARKLRGNAKLLSSYLMFQKLRKRRARRRAGVTKVNSEQTNAETGENTNNDVNELLVRIFRGGNVSKISYAYLEHGKYDFSILTHQNVRLNRYARQFEKVPEAPEALVQQQWERKHWHNRSQKDVRSENVLEIVSNGRMVAFKGEGLPQQANITVFLECLRYALKEHSWTNACLSLLGFVKECGRHCYQAQKQFPCIISTLWTFGFLTVINHFKDDVSMVMLFAKHVKQIFPGVYPLYFGTHLAVWLIQKGYFMAAYKILTEDYSPELESMGVTLIAYYRRRYFLEENPKRDQVLFVCELIKATYLYFMWKKEQSLQDLAEEFAEFPELEEIMRRKGEYALAAYEKLFVLQRTTGTDVMIFLKPFIELLVEYRSVTRAFDVLEELWPEYDGNVHFENFYIDFVEKYSPNPNEIPEILKKIKARNLNRYICTIDARVKDIARRKINKLRKKRKREGICKTFTNIPNPPFSL